MLSLMREAQRRRVFTTAGLYIVGAWLVMQGGDVFFSGWGIPDRGINVLLIAAISGFPLALVFGWFFNITKHGIRRTLHAGPDEISVSRPLKGGDYVVLAALLLASGVIVTRATQDILDMRNASPGPEAIAVEKLPNSIAVLPFANMSNDPENESFSDGVSEEIRNRLGLHAELQVIARTSSFQFKHGDYSIPRISEMLGVRYLLQGSVRREGDRIRVTAQLVADRGTQIWSKNYDRVLDDVFGLQDEIADLVATEVAPQISTTLDRKYTPNLVAYENFLTGRDLLNRRGNQWKAQRELAKAVQMDPGFAEAQAEYAISLLLGYPEQLQFDKADAAIDAALGSVANLPRALAARGLYFSQQPSGDLDAAEAALRAALQGDPNMVDAMNWLSGVLGRKGEQQEAEKWNARAYALDPFNSAITANLAHKYWANGNPERAESLLLPLIDLPDLPMQAPMTLWTLYSDTGRLVEANRMAKMILGKGSWPVWFLAQNYAVLGEMETAADLVTMSVLENPNITWTRSGWLQAQTPYWKGDYQEAVDQMREAMAANDIAPEALAPELRQFYGINLALAGDSAAAIDTLAKVLPDAGEWKEVDGVYTVDAYQALAWSYRHAGMPEASRELLETLKNMCEQYSDSVAMIKSSDYYLVARNYALMGNTDLALDQLEKAVAAGWSEYNIQRHDPRWAALADDTRYQAIMAGVKADVDRQRDAVARIDAGEGFSALHDGREKGQGERANDE